MLVKQMLFDRGKPEQVPNIRPKRTARDLRTQSCVLQWTEEPTIKITEGKQATFKFPESLEQCHQYRNTKL